MSVFPTNIGGDGQTQHARVESRGGKDLVLEGVQIQANLHGLLFELDIEHRYINPNPGPVEILYVFPVPYDAELLAAEAWIGENHLVGKVLEKVTASVGYDDAVSQGDTALLLEDTGNGLWHMSLGNLGKAETCRLRIRYAQRLSFKSGSLRLIIPTVVAPRYGAPSGSSEPWKIPQHELTAEYPFSIRISIHGQPARATMASPSHPIQLRWEEETLVVQTTQPAFLDRDFVLQLNDLPQQSLALQSRKSARRVLAAASFCPKLPTLPDSRSQVKILVDCSGSMNGTSMIAAKRALAELLNGLKENDRFSLSRFGGTVQHFRKGWQVMNEESRRKALQWVDGLQADLGGTEMEAALRSAFDLADGEAADVLLITDGGIDAVDRTVQAARQSGHRVFTVGIGASPAATLLNRLAEETGGACEFVAPGEEVSQAVLRMAARLKGAAGVSGLRLQWPDGIRPLWQSAMPKGIFAGDTLSIYAKLPVEVCGSVQLLGVLQGEQEEVCLGEAVLETLPDKHDTLIRMAAAAEVRELLGRGRNKDALAISLSNQLVNSLTASLMVLERKADDKQGDMPQQVVVKQMMPAGLGGYGFMASTGLFGVVSNCIWPQALAGGHRHLVTPTLLAKQGMQPLPFIKTLQGMTKAHWPRSLDELRNFGLDDAVIDWLGQVIGECADMTESEVVALFLSICTSKEMADLLTGSRLRRGFNTLSAKLHSRISELRGRKEARADYAKSLMLKALKNISEYQWPSFPVDEDAD